MTKIVKSPEQIKQEHVKYTASYKKLNDERKRQQESFGKAHPGGYPYVNGKIVRTPESEKYFRDYDKHVTVTSDHIADADRMAKKPRTELRQHLLQSGGYSTRGSADKEAKKQLREYGEGHDMSHHGEGKEHK